MINNNFSNNINKDFIKSLIIHAIIVFYIVVMGFLQNRKIFSNIASVNNAPPVVTTEQKIVQATLVDHQMVQQALKRQEMQAAEKVIREKKIQQQEQQLSQLTKTVEQEMQKAKQDREKLKKEQDVLQQTANKLKQQAKDLATQQEKLAKKKNSQASITEQKNTNNLQAVQSVQAVQSMIKSEISNYHAKWHTEIVNNRKRTMFFPDNLTCSVKIKVLPSGQLALVKIDKSSGNSAYDNFSQQAIYKSAPFEMPQDPLVNKELAELEHIFDFDDSAFNND